MINNMYEEVTLDEYAEAYFFFKDWLESIGEDTSELIVYN